MFRQAASVRKKKTAFFRNENGGTMVEFAIAASIFVLMLMGILEFGYATWTKNSLASDARQGARYAIVHGGQSGAVADSAAIANYVKSKTGLGSSIVVQPTWSDPSGKLPGSRVAVKVKRAIPRFGPILPARTDSSISTMIVLF